MPESPPPAPPRPRPIACAGLLVLALACATAAADRNDRSKPLTMESDRPCTVDLVKQLSICSGNVVISQGTLLIRAERIELRESPDGFRSASAVGAPGKPAQYRQRREGSDEYVEGSAERVEYDGRNDTIRFIGNASVRRSRGGVVADEIVGQQIVWDNAAEQFSVQGGEATTGNPGGRVRAVLAPRGDAASAPAAKPAPGLKSSNSLGERR